MAGMALPLADAQHRLGAEAEFWDKLQPGVSFFVWYQDDSVWHERIALFPMSETKWAVGTPDADIYVESLAFGCENDGLVGGILRNVDGSPPATPDPLYLFPAPVDDATRRLWMKQGSPSPERS